MTVRLGLQQDAGVASAPNQIEIPRPGHHRRAALPLEAEVVVAPTLQVGAAGDYKLLVTLECLCTVPQLHSCSAALWRPASGHFDKLQGWGKRLLTRSA